jgi:hypothetical protein
MCVGTVCPAALVLVPGDEREEQNPVSDYCPPDYPTCWISYVRVQYFSMSLSSLHDPDRCCSPTTVQLRALLVLLKAGSNTS